MSISRQSNEHGISYLTSDHRNTNLSLLCIHGWACQGSDYSYLMNELEKRHVRMRSVAVDLPGNGGSSTKHYPVGDVTTMAGAVIALINELDVNDVVLVGHSMGVRIVSEIWLQSQNLGKPIIKGIVFLDGSHYKLRKTLFAFDKGDARSSGLSKEAKMEGMKEAFKRMFSKRTPEQFQASALMRFETMDLEYNEGVRQSFIQYDYEKLDDSLQLLGQAGVPLLSFQATKVDEQNQRTPLASGEISSWMRLVQEKVPQAQQAFVEDSMHFPHVDQPTKVAERLAIFLEALGT